MKQKFTLQIVTMIALFFAFVNLNAQTTYGNFPYEQSFLSAQQPSEVSTPGSNNAVMFTDKGVQLTPAAGNQFGAIFLNDKRFSSINGINIEFEYMVYGGNGADGFTVFFFDADVVNPTIGATGASIGYTYNRALTNSYPAQRKEGLQGAYLGIAFDSYGLFKSTRFQSEEIKSGIGTTYAGQSHVTLRGARGKGYPNENSPLTGMGAGFSGYPVLVSQTTLDNDGTSDNAYVLLNDNGDYHILTQNGNYQGDFNLRGGFEFSDANDIGYRKAIIELYPFPNFDGMYVTVKIQHENDTTLVIDSYPYKDITKYRETAIVDAQSGDGIFGQIGQGSNPIVSNPLDLNTTIPDFVRVGFAAATGANFDYHIIKNLKITLPGAAEANDDHAHTLLQTPVNIPILDNDIAYSGVIGSNLTGGSQYIDKTSLRFVPVTGGTSISPYKYQTNQGVWEYNSTTGIVTFTPDTHFIGTARIQYTMSGSGAPFGDAAYRSNAATIDVKVNCSPTGYDKPLNVVPDTTFCVDDMLKNVEFGIREKFRTAARTAASGFVVDALSSPLVGDLNGDGKPEIVAVGVNHALNYVTARNNFRYISIFNGQDGSEIYSYNMGKNYQQGSGVNNTYGYHRPPTLMALADLDRDGIGEIVVTTPDGEVMALKPVYDINMEMIDMVKMWDATVSCKEPYTTAERFFNTPSPYIVDINGDGHPEVVVYNKIYNGQTGELLMSWQGAASTPTGSNIATGLSNTRYGNASVQTTTQANATGIKTAAMLGVRPVGGAHADPYTAVPAIWDIDDDGAQEIITGNRIHKFNIPQNAQNASQCTYTTIEGPVSVALPENTDANAPDVVHYLSDGFTRVADIDGDGFLDIIVVSSVTGTANNKILVYVWDPRFPNVVKAALTYNARGSYGTFGIPFVGDINGKKDGWDGSAYTKKLPEICIIAGNTYIDRATTQSGRTGIKFHPTTDENLRRGVGWDNNNTSTSTRRFNGTSAGRFGHIIGLTYDDQATRVEEKLKLSWALEHADASDVTGITLFDFDNDGAKDLCYRDERTIRVISPARANNGAGSDYVEVTEVPSATSSVLFSEDCFSGTGFEYPTIADVNLDGSANIVVIGCDGPRDAGKSGGNIRVYEYASGGQKWAPCPPVWNQALYNPLHINEDLTVPVSPQPMLTQYVTDINGTDEVIQPYNGAWIQQPIVKEGGKYIPVVRQPDAIITDMEIEVVTTTPAKAIITLTIFNNGTASIGASNPITFYVNDEDESNFNEANIVNTLEVGVDVFPGETYKRNYEVFGNFNKLLMWARIMDDGINFPGAGLMDCDTTNNLASGIDCPYLEYTVVSLPSDGLNVICGNNGSIVLKAVNTNPQQATPHYTWYRDNLEIPNSNSPIYVARQAGVYKCFVVEDICRSYSVNEYGVTKISGNFGDIPVLTSIPENAKICGNNGKVYMHVSGFENTNALYYLYKNGEYYSGPNNKPNTFVSDPGEYIAIVTSDGCTFVSNIITVGVDTGSSIGIPLIENVYGTTNVCESGGKTLLRVVSPSHTSGMTYHWFLDGVHIDGATERWYVTQTSGSYQLLVIDAAGCSAISTATVINTKPGYIDEPIIAKRPNLNHICDGGGMLMEVSNYTKYTNPTYTWYKNGQTVKSGSSRFYNVTDAGSYFVAVEMTSCTSISSIENITGYPTTIDPVEIESYEDATVLCGQNSSIILNIKSTDIKPSQTYQWLKDGEPIDGATSTMYVANQAGKYSVFVVEGGCATYSDEIEFTQGGVTNFKKPVLLASLDNAQLCEPGSHVYLFIDNTDDYDTPDYIWYKGDTIVQTGTGSTLIVTETGNYSVYVYDHSNNCSAMSDTRTVTESIGGGGYVTSVTIASASGGTVICGVDGIVILALQETYNNVNYFWIKDDLLYTEHADYTNSVIRITEPGNYYLRVVDGVCSYKSNIIQVTYSATGGLPTPDLRRIPGSGGVCATDGSVYLYIYNHLEYSNATYTWLLNNQAIVMESENPWHDAVQAGVYSVIVAANDCNIESNSITLTDSQTGITKPQIGPTIGNNIICSTPGVVVLKLTNPQSYTGITGYQWFKDGLPIDGATRPIYVATTAGKYKLRVMQANCSAASVDYTVTSGNTGVTVNVPTLSLDPGAQMCVGGVTQIKVSNNNLFPGATYIWYKDDVIVQTGTETTYYADSPARYFVQAYYSGCSSVSAEQNITSSQNTITTPIVASEPNPAIICGTNGAAVLTLTNYSSFTSPASFTWYKNDVLITGQTNPVLVVDNVMGAGKYRVRVQNGSGCVTYSSEISVTYSAQTVTAPIINPTDAIIYPGSPPNDVVVISITNPDNNAVKYVWYNDNGILKTDLMPGTVSYTANSSGNYFVQVVYSNGCSAVSENSVVTASGNHAPKPVLRVYPESLKICQDGGMGVIEITNLSDYNNPSFQWYRVVGGINQPVGTEERLLLNPVFINPTAGTYFVVVTDVISGSPTPSIPSDQKTFTVSNTSITKPSISSNGSRLCGPNSKILFYVNNTNDYSNNVIYRWIKDFKEIQIGSNPYIEISQVGIYSLQVIDGDCFSESNNMNIQDYGGDVEIPLIEILGGNLQLCGENATVILRVTNANQFPTSECSFNWYYNNMPIVGERDSILRVTNDLIQSGNIHNFRVAANCIKCPSLSDNIQLPSYNNDLVKPVLEKIPNSGVICGSNGSVFLRISNVSSFPGINYYWFRNGTEIVQHGSNTSYEVTSPGTYSVYAVGTTCATESLSETITKDDYTNITKPQLSAPMGNLCSGSSEQLILMSTPENVYSNPTYQWFKGTDLLPGKTKPRLVVGTGDAGQYRLLVTDGNCSAFSNTITIQAGSGQYVYSPTIAVIDPIHQICKVGGTTLIKLTNTSNFIGATFHWYNGNSLVQTTTSPDLYVSAEGTYYLVAITSDGCSAVSNEIVISSSATQINKPVVVAVPDKKVLCGTNGTVLLGLTNPTDFVGYSYRWYKDNAPLTEVKTIRSGIPELFYTVTSPGIYRINIYQNECVTFSEPDTITYIAGGGLASRPTITTDPPNGKICGTNGSVILRANGSASYPSGTTFVWYRDDVRVKTSTEDFYIATGQEGAGEYHLQAILSNDCSSSSSHPGVTITYVSSASIAKPAIVSRPTLNNICGNDGVVLLSLSNVIQYSNTTFQWYKDNAPILGATNINYKAKTAGDYYLLAVSSDNCSAISNTIKLTTSPSGMVAPIVSADPPQLCGMLSSVILSVTNKNSFAPGSTYIWFEGDNIIAEGADLSIYEVSSVGRYYVQVIDATATCATLSSEKHITDSGYEIQVLPNIETS